MQGTKENLPVWAVEGYGMKKFVGLLLALAMMLGACCAWAETSAARNESPTVNGVLASETNTSGDGWTWDPHGTLRVNKSGLTISNWENKSQLVLIEISEELTDIDLTLDNVQIRGSRAALSWMGAGTLNLTLTGGSSLTGTSAGMYYENDGEQDAVLNVTGGTLSGGFSGISASRIQDDDVLGSMTINVRGTQIDASSAIHADRWLGKTGSIRVYVDDGAVLNGGIVLFNPNSKDPDSVTLGRNVIVRGEPAVSINEGKDKENNVLEIDGRTYPGVSGSWSANGDGSEWQTIDGSPFKEKSDNLYDAVGGSASKYLCTGDAELRQPDPPGSDNQPQNGGLPDTDSLPRTGDPSMLGAWVCLLAASGAGMRLRRKNPSVGR